MKRRIIAAVLIIALAIAVLPQGPAVKAASTDLYEYLLCVYKDSENSDELFYMAVPKANGSYPVMILMDESDNLKDDESFNTYAGYINKLACEGAMEPVILVVPILDHNGSEPAEEYQQFVDDKSDHITVALRNGDFNNIYLEDKSKSDKTVARKIDKTKIKTVTTREFFVSVNSYKNGNTLSDDADSTVIASESDEDTISGIVNTNDNAKGASNSTSPVIQSVTTTAVNGCVLKGQEYTITVNAAGSNLKYQWEWCTDGKSWANSTSEGNTSATIKLQGKRNVVYYRCKVTSGSVTVTSSVITIKMNLYITPEMFDAVGDGSTDDTKAFEKMIEYVEGHTDGVAGPSGVYNINAPVCILKSGATYKITDTIHIGCSFLQISGNGATIKSNNQKRVFAFDIDDQGRCPGLHSEFSNINFVNCLEPIWYKYVNREGGKIIVNNCSFKSCKGYAITTDRQSCTVMIRKNTFENCERYWSSTCNDMSVFEDNICTSFVVTSDYKAPIKVTKKNTNEDFSCRILNNTFEASNSSVSGRAWIECGLTDLTVEGNRFTGNAASMNVVNMAPLVTVNQDELTSAVRVIDNTFNNSKFDKIVNLVGIPSLIQITGNREGNSTTKLLGWDSSVSSTTQSSLIKGHKYLKIIAYGNQGFNTTDIPSNLKIYVNEYFTSQNGSTDVLTKLEKENEELKKENEELRQQYDKLALNTVSTQSIYSGSNERKTLIRMITGANNGAGIYVTPEMFGAVGDGSTDDTEALSNMFTYIEEHTSIKKDTGGNYSISAPFCVLRSGATYWVKKNTIHVPCRVLIIVGNAAKIKSDNSVRILAFDKGDESGWRTMIDKVEFINCKEPIWFDNRNLADGKITISQCKFHEATGYAITTKRPGCRVTVTDCTFMAGDRYWYSSGCTEAVLKDSWVSYYRLSDSEKAPLKVLKGSDTGAKCSLHVSNNCFVPTPSSVKGRAWIESDVSDILIDGNRFGGEEGSIPVINVASGINTNNAVPTSLRILNNMTTNGDNRVVNLIGLPTYMEITGNKGFYGHTVIAEWDSSVSTETQKKLIDSQKSFRFVMYANNGYHIDDKHFFEEIKSNIPSNLVKYVVTDMNSSGGVAVIEQTIKNDQLKAENDRLKADIRKFLKPGWNKENGQWYYLDSQYNKKTGWLKDGLYWYYMDKDGVMQTGWIQISGYWYYLGPTGIMRTGWIKVGTKWYYLNPTSGAMRTNNWVQTAGKWYYLKADGSMAVNEWVCDGKYHVNSSGVWDK